MRETWLYCPTLRPGPLTLADSEARHATQSLRLRASDAVTVFDGNGPLGRGAIEAPSTAASKRNQRQPLTLLVETIRTIPRSTHELILIVPGCKGARLDWLIEKGTELGVSRFILAEFEHSIVRTGLQHARKLERTAIEACKQCHRDWLPQIESGGSLVAAIAAVAGATLLVAHLEPEAPALASWLNTHSSAVARLAAVIGPEGGLSAMEIEALRLAGGQMIRLAKHVLRVETAALAVAACWAAAAPAAA